ncbi:hypothetical protein [Liquorilactobacillus capillatus]|uniref:TPR repeat-containing protein n=1 Tax=Liquorilactobacillus capillatus DSM 19910 TaxID=1423731 RepID=A0A0R1M076_9LACO|nr:hypothetical protein [Liquorilactobacillus capillatus]KRL01373.1 hypothetical protein FC81_GL001518 [Liquorilactobacillus capillatus DSM 19910]
MADDDTLLFEQGMAALEKGAYEEANQLLTQCYLNKKTFRLNFLLATSLARSGAFKDAAELAEEYLIEYLKNNEYFKKYILFNTGARRFIYLKKLLCSIDAYLSDKERTNFVELLTEEEERYTKANTQKLAKMRKEIMHCGQGAVYEQRSLFQKAYFLPSSLFIQVGEYLLNDPDIHPLIKSNILDDLRILNISQEISFSSLDGQKHVVIPARLHALEETAVYAYFKDKLQQSDNLVLRDKQWNEVKLQLIILYPYEKKIVQPSELWLQVLLCEKQVTGFSMQIQNWLGLLRKELLAWQI